MIRAFTGMIVIALLSFLALNQTPTPASAPTFEVADVHASSPTPDPPFLHDGYLIGDLYVLRQATMLDVISAAHDLSPTDVQGGRSWLEWDRFDVIAKAPATTPPATVKLMLRSLRKERFNLVVHNGVAPNSAYVLTIDKHSLMKKSNDEGDARCERLPEPANPAPDTMGRISISCHNETMELFAKDLYTLGRGYLTQPVVDATGIEGSWDFGLKWTGRQLLEKAGVNGVSIFEAVQKQLGLKLTPQTVPRPVLFVDAAREVPTANALGIDKSLPALPPAQFEVATIRPSRLDEKPAGVHSGDRINIQAFTLKDLIDFASDLNRNDSAALRGAPKWLDRDRFDFQGKIATEDSGNLLPDSPRIDRDQYQDLVRGLIESRFRLRFHIENQPITAYALIAVNPKLFKADPPSRTRCVTGPGADGKGPRLTNPMLDGLVACQNVTMAQFGEALRGYQFGYFYAPARDDTGLKGS